MQSNPVYLISDNKNDDIYAADRGPPIAHHYINFLYARAQVRGEVSHGQHL